MANNGMFLPTSFVKEVASLSGKRIDSSVRESLVGIYRILNDMAIKINLKETGIYGTEEFVTGEVYYPDPALNSTTANSPTLRSVFSKVIIFGALPAAGTKSVAHGLAPTASFIIIDVYGNASDQAGLNYIKLSYASPVLVDNIELWADATNVNVKVGKDQSAYTNVNIVLKYIKS